MKIRNFNLLILVLLTTFTVLVLFACGTSGYTLNTSIEPRGSGKITPSGRTYEPGANLTITAEPASGYRFDYWSGNITGSSNSFALTMDSSKTVIAHFKRQYDLSTSVIPATAGTVIPPSGTYDSNTLVTITAASTSGYRFDYWSGDATGSSDSVNITMDSNKRVTAHFNAFYTLTTSVSPPNYGTITTSPLGAAYDAGTKVTITAKATSGYSFVSWSGNATGSSSSITVTMDGDKTVVAHFQAVPVASGQSLTWLWIVLGVIGGLFVIKLISDSSGEDKVICGGCAHEFTRKEWDEKGLCPRCGHAFCATKPKD